ncbi:hypothetical protein MK786_02585 [Microbacterium sp. CFH 31415]|jgi:hypothetical protein|nr:hypothetical protein [Microbacterium sp. CFH 31415]MCH6229620.1 hypothetical protein [Microbacterium sp. CFH 31415]
MEVQLTADLVIGDKGCVQAETAGGTVNLVWPSGYTVHGDSQAFTVLNADGDAVAASGSTVTMTGGPGDEVDAAWANADCIDGEPWMVGAAK